MLRDLEQGKRIKVIAGEHSGNRGNLIEKVAPDAALVELDNGFQCILTKDEFIEKGV